MSGISSYLSNSRVEADQVVVRRKRPKPFQATIVEPCSHVHTDNQALRRSECVAAACVIIAVVSTVDPTKLRVRVVFENGMSTDDHQVTNSSSITPLQSTMVKSFVPFATLLLATASAASVPDGTWPTSTGTVQYAEAYIIKAGEVFDGKMQTFERSDVSCEGQTESGA
ncbi:hypothetical protein F443_06878, partial [Phytophthora nicotianae P1569]